MIIGVWRRASGVEDRYAFQNFLGVEGGNRMDIEIDFVVSVESEVHAIAEGDTVRQGLHEQFAAQGYESIVTLSADRWVA